MVKPVIALVSLLGGALAAGLAVYIQVDPSVLTTATEPSATQNSQAPTQAAPEKTSNVVSAPAVEHGVITLEPVEIRAVPSRIRTPAPAIKPAPAPATEPCSNWRELGPKSSDSAASGTHRVRQLCTS